MALPFEVPREPFRLAVGDRTRAQNNVPKDAPLERLTCRCSSLTRVLLGYCRHNLERRCELDRLVQCAIKRATHGVNSVHAFY